MVDGEDQTFGALAQAKKLAEDVGMAKAVADGFVEPAAAKPAPDPQPAAPAAPPINSISGRSVPLLVGQRLPAEVIAEEVENRISQFAHQPRGLIRERAEGVLPGASDDDAVAGAVYDGAIYLFRDQLANRSEVRATLFHELLHYGLRRIFSRAQFIREMRSLYERDAWIKARADAWATSADGCGRRSPAVMAQTTPELGYVKRAIAAIRAFLCKHIPGFANMKLADAEIIQQYILLLLPVVISECLGTS